MGQDWTTNIGLRNALFYILKNYSTGVNHGIHYVWSKFSLILNWELILGDTKGATIDDMGIKLKWRLILDKSLGIQDRMTYLYQEYICIYIIGPPCVTWCPVYDS